MSENKKQQHSEVDSIQGDSAPVSLKLFQADFARYLRDPSNEKLPAGIPARRSRVYEELLFNNVCGFINNCFPVAVSLFDKEQWLVICRAFFKEWSCSTPIFSQIPFEFVQFIGQATQQLSVPPYLAELLHYEWVELEVDISESTVLSSKEPLLILNPSARLLAYQWPVHQISSANCQPSAQPTFLAVWRNADFSVSFSELNATTYLLLQQIGEQSQSFDQVMASIAKQLGRDDIAALSDFAKPLLQTFLDQQLLCGAI